MVIKPYTDLDLTNNTFERTITKDVDENSLVWHMDEFDRWVEVGGEKLEKNFWQLQFENDLPINLIYGQKYFIPKKTFHRVLKGDGDLVMKIKEENV